MPKIPAWSFCDKRQLCRIWPICFINTAGPVCPDVQYGFPTPGGWTLKNSLAGPRASGASFCLQCLIGKIYVLVARNLLDSGYWNFHCVRINVDVQQAVRDNTLSGIRIAGREDHRARVLEQIEACLMIALSGLQDSV